jgi:hypothetical protein
MKTHLGIHIGMKDKIPATDEQYIAMIRSSALWQEHNGPIVIFVDELFYEWMYEKDLEQCYQDIIPIDGDIETEEGVINRIKTNAPYESIFIINLDDFALPGGDGKVFSVRKEMEQKDFVDLQVELLPDEYKKLWQQQGPAQTQQT